MDINKIKDRILKRYNRIYNIYTHNDKVIVEQEYNISEKEKNSDGCCSAAKQSGDIIVRDFPMMEVDDYYCSRGKYAVVELSFKNDGTERLKAIHYSIADIITEVYPDFEKISGHVEEYTKDKYDTQQKRAVLIVLKQFQDNEYIKPIYDKITKQIEAKTGRKVI